MEPQVSFPYQLSEKKMIYPENRLIPNSMKMLNNKLQEQRKTLRYKQPLKKKQSEQRRKEKMPRFGRNQGKSAPSPFKALKIKEMRTGKRTNQEW